MSLGGAIVLTADQIGVLISKYSKDEEAKFHPIWKAKQEGNSATLSTLLQTVTQAEKPRLKSYADDWNAIAKNPAAYQEYINRLKAKQQIDQQELAALTAKRQGMTPQAAALMARGNAPAAQASSSAPQARVGVGAPGTRF